MPHAPRHRPHQPIHGAVPAESLYRRLGGLAAGTLLAVALAGCASMSEKECAVADWQEKGTRDALSGYTRERMEDHREACVKAGIAPDPQRYLRGWSQGIAEFCTPDNGLRWGREGREYRQSCPPQLEGAFLEPYERARRVYNAERNVRNLLGEQRTKQRQLDSAKDDDQRRRFRGDLRSLDDRLRYARDELYDAERRLNRRY